MLQSLWRSKVAVQPSHTAAVAACAATALVKTSDALGSSSTSRGRVAWLFLSPSLLRVYHCCVSVTQQSLTCCYNTLRRLFRASAVSSAAVLLDTKAQRDLLQLVLLVAQACVTPRFPMLRYHAFL